MCDTMLPTKTSQFRDFDSIRERDVIHLCIPSVDRSITAEYISSKIASLGIGIVSRIIFSANRDSDYKKAIIYFDSWREDEKTARIIQGLKETGCLSIVYDFPKLWKCRILISPANDRDATATAAAARASSSSTSSPSNSYRKSGFSSMPPPTTRRAYVPAPPLTDISGNSNPNRPPRNQSRTFWQ
jgi:hypothetical protein